jgi:hypothetical protein
MTMDGICPQRETENVSHIKGNRTGGVSFQSTRPAGAFVDFDARVASRLPENLCGEKVDPAGINEDRPRSKRKNKI